MTSRRQKYRLYHFGLVSLCLFFLKTFFMYARPIPVQTKVHFQTLQFLAVTYDMGGGVKVCFRRYQNGSVFSFV